MRTLLSPDVLAHLLRVKPDLDVLIHSETITLKSVFLTEVVVVVVVLVYVQSITFISHKQSLANLAHRV